VVAVVLIKSKEAEPVVKEVVMVGEVPKTNEPVPVVPVTEALKLSALMLLVNAPPVVVATNRLAVKEEKVIVPEEVNPVKEERVPVIVELPVTLTPPEVTVRLSVNRPEPAIFKA
jgi:hypothetical protein